MKSSSCLIAVVVAGAMVLQGCAQTGVVRSDAPQVASPSVEAPAAAPPAAEHTAAAIPENDHGKPVIAADTKDNFEAVAAAIRQQMQTGGRFAFVDPKGRSVVDGGLNDMATVFTQYGSVDKMGPSARSRLMDDQNAINDVLARYDSNRLICHDEMPVGSHLPKRVCRTLGQIHNDKQNANELMRRMRNSGSNNDQ